MNPTDLQSLIESAQPVAAALNSLGIPGLIALALSGPLMIAIAVLVMMHVSMTRIERVQQAHAHDVSILLDAYRSDTAATQRENARQHAEVVTQYNNNVELVRAYRQMTEGFQVLVVNNTRVLERLVTIIESGRIRSE